MTKKEIKNLTNMEIWEDMVHWIGQAQLRSPSFNDEIFSIIKKYLIELKKRLNHD